MSGMTAQPQKAAGQPRPQIRVLVTDDSAVIRGIVSRWIEADSNMAVAAVAINGADAINKAKSCTPDVIVLDIEMPQMDGLTALPQLLKACPKAKIIMASTLTRRNAEISLKALSLGATDYVPKPTSIGGGAAAEEFRRELISRIAAIGSKSLGPLQQKVVLDPGPRPATLTTRKFSPITPQIVAIGSSTGGPQALTTVIGALARGIRVPVLLTQHMPATFTSILAESLGRSSGLKCVEGANGMRLEPGVVYVAPGDYHMTIKGKGGPIELVQTPPENFCRPSVDPMFRSVVAAYGASTLGVVLTGMGSDGREGARAIAQVGGNVIAQDEATSVVWGMPAAVAQSGLATHILPLLSVGPEILKILGHKPR